MPYQLHCPSCEHTSESPFVRVGAMAQCPACGSIYRIKAGHVMRPQRAVSRSISVNEMTGSGSPIATADEEEAVTLSGLSELIEREAGPLRRSQRPVDPDSPTGQKPSPPAKAKPQTPPAKKPATKPAQPQKLNKISRRPKKKKTNQRRFTMLIPFFAGAILMGLIAVGLTQRDRINQVSDTSGQGHDGSSSSAVINPSTENSAPNTALAMEMISRVVWLEQNKESGIPLLIPDSKNDMVVLQNTRQRFFQRGMLISTQVQNQSEHIIDFATIVLVIASPDGSTELARTTTQVGLLNPNEELPLLVDMPDSLASSEVRIVAWVENHEEIPDAWLSKKPTVKVNDDMIGNNLWLEIPNTHDQDASRMIAILQASDNSGNPLGVWRLTWKNPVPAQGQASFACNPAIDVMWPEITWTLRAAMIGQPASNPPTP